METEKGKDSMVENQANQDVNTGFRNEVSVISNDIQDKYGKIKESYSECKTILSNVQEEHGIIKKYPPL